MCVGGKVDLILDDARPSIWVLLTKIQIWTQSLCAQLNFSEPKILLRYKLVLCVRKRALKVSKFQNEFMKSKFLPKYEPKIVRNVSKGVPHYKADILTIFGSYFGRNDRLINSFWNFLTFSDRGCNFICRKAVKLIYFEWRRTFSWVLLTSKYAVLDGLKSLHNWISHRDFSETLFVLYELGWKLIYFEFS